MMEFLSVGIVPIALIWARHSASAGAASPRITADIALRQRPAIVTLRDYCSRARANRASDIRVIISAYARRVYGEFAPHLWHRTAGSARPGARGVHRADG